MTFLVSASLVLWFFLSIVSFVMCCSVKQCMAKCDEFLFHGLRDGTVMFFFPSVSSPSFSSLFLVNSELLNRIQRFGSSCALQTGCSFA